MNNKHLISRRGFMKTAAGAPGAVTVGAPAILRAQNLNDKLNIAMIATGGRGGSNLDTGAVGPEREAHVWVGRAGYGDTGAGRLLRSGLAEGGPALGVSRRSNSP